MEIYEDNADKDIAIHAKQALKLASRFISMKKKKTRLVFFACTNWSIMHLHASSKL